MTKTMASVNNDNETRQMRRGGWRVFLIGAALVGLLLGQSGASPTARADGGPAGQCSGVICPEPTPDADYPQI